MSVLFDQSIKSANPYPIPSSSWNKKNPTIYTSTELPARGGTPIPMPSHSIAVAWPEHDVSYLFSSLSELSEGKRNGCNSSAYLLVCPIASHTHQKTLNPLTIFSKTRKIKEVCDKSCENW